MFISLRGEKQEVTKTLNWATDWPVCWRRAQTERRSGKKQGTARHQVKHGCCQWEWYDTSVWDVVPIKVSEEQSFSLRLTFPLPLCSLISGESFEQSAFENKLSAAFFKKTQQICWKYVCGCSERGWGGDENVKKKLVWNLLMWKTATERWWCWS